MNTLNYKRILVGISGGIAAYKSADLVRRLRELGADVRVAMTRSACEFITPLTMQAVSGKPVHLELLDHAIESGMGHIELARWCDVVLIAPASANFMARVAQGLADDLLTTICLATTAPVYMAPAMNREMWLNDATQHNAGLLQQRGISLLGPGTGEQACGETGPGRMLEPEQLIAGLQSLFQTQELASRKLLITAGPTREYIDPVRYISNRSSGRMGYAVAHAALEAGASVTLVSGPVNLELPEYADCVQVTTAGEMYRAVMQRISGCDIFISAAAVADYSCTNIAGSKIKKSDTDLSLKLDRNPDILAAVAATKPPPFTVGFAAETDNLLENARQKLTGKKLDMIAANQVGDELGFDSEENELHLLWQNGEKLLSRASKAKLARELIHIVAEQFNKGNSAPAN